MSTAHHLRRAARAFAVVGLGAYAVGTLVGIARLEPDLFHRFGALGVAAAVLFFTDRLLKIESERQRHVERLLHEYGAELVALREGDEARTGPSTGAVIDYLTEERDLARLRTRADRVQVANIGLLTVSTLQWGFGDLFLAMFTPEGGA